MFDKGKVDLAKLAADISDPPSHRTEYAPAVPSARELAICVLALPAYKLRGICNRFGMNEQILLSWARRNV